MFDNFIYPSKENFPKEECIIKDDNEERVFLSENIYRVIYNLAGKTPNL